MGTGKKRGWRGDKSRNVLGLVLSDSHLKLGERPQCIPGIKLEKVP